MNRSLVFALLLIPACGDRDDDDPPEEESTDYDGVDVARDAQTVYEDTTTEAGVAQLMVPYGYEETRDEAGLCDSMEALADEFDDGDCLTMTCAGYTITAEFDQCSGYYGLADLSGTITGTYGFDADGISISIETTGLGVGDTTIDMSAAAEVPWTMDALQLETTTTITHDSVEVTFGGEYAVGLDYDAECVTLDGEWSAAFPNSTWGATATALEKCAGECPSGSVTLSAEAAGDGY